MKAKISPRITLDNRTKLEEVIPLDTPFILFVDPSSICNFRCKFCPTGYSEIIKATNRSQTLMEPYLFKKVIDDIGKFDKPLKVLRLYKDGEPLINPHLSEMVKYAKDSRYIEYIDTTTNGFLITEKRMKPIIDAGLDKINISINGLDDKQFLEFTGIKVNFSSYVENIKKLYEIKENCEIVIKTTGDFLTEEDKNKFYTIFGDICDKIFIENTVHCWPEFDVEHNTKINISKTKGIYNNELSDVETCPYIFYQMSINSDGIVSLCFLDWARKLIIGDVRRQSLKDIWFADKLFKYQMNNLNGKRKDNVVCNDCGQLKYCMPDNIDPYTNILKERLLNMKGDQNGH